jgi:2-polyprenyl-6-hydroxyphenyl methylase/3-demethylubiquinone-9 3-methyltransferase
MIESASRPAEPPSPPGRTSVDPAEVARFSAIAAQWWDPNGKFAVLHRFNPVRIAWIRDQTTALLQREPVSLKPLAGLRLLDVGCGGGLLSEPMARLGADVVAIDPSEKNIRTAMTHAAEHDLPIDYRATTAEALAAAGERFDVVLAMEVVEHVADVKLFLSRCAEMVKPGGLMVAATLNRTLKSFAMAIVGAEYVLGWLPRGTHQWDRFVTPAELSAALTGAGLRLTEEMGVVYNPLADVWRLSRDTSVNYMMVATRPA